MFPARYGLTRPALDSKNYTQSEIWEIGDILWLKIYDKRLSLIQGMCTTEKLVLIGTHLELSNRLKKINVYYWDTLVSLSLSLSLSLW
jgi:hypothetical protein